MVAGSAGGRAYSVRTLPVLPGRFSAARKTAHQLAFFSRFFDAGQYHRFCRNPIVAAVAPQADAADAAELPGAVGEAADTGGELNEAADEIPEVSSRDKFARFGR